MSKYIVEVIIAIIFILVIALVGRDYYIKSSECEAKNGLFLKSNSGWVCVAKGSQI